MRRRAAGGFSLLESIVALALAGLLLTGVIQGLFVTVTASSQAKDLALANARLAAISERFTLLEMEPGFYTPCPGTPAAIAAQLDAALRASPGNTLDGVTFSIPTAAPRAVTFWNGASYSATCPSVDRGAQMVPLRVTVGTGGSAVTVDGVVVLRNPWAKP